VALRLTFFSLTALAFATCCVGGGKREKRERERERESRERDMGEMIHFSER
jgi:hypothetical protein